MVETRSVLLEDHLHALRLVQDNPVLTWICGNPDLFRTIWLFHLRREYEIFTIFGMRTSFALSLREWICDGSKFASSPMSETPAYGAHLWNVPGQTFLPNWWSLGWPLAAIGWYSHYHRTKRNYWSSEWFSKSAVIRCFPVWLEVLNVSQKAGTFHGISPPFFIQA